MRKGLGFVLAGGVVAVLGIGGGAWWAIGHPLPSFVAAHFELPRHKEKAEKKDPALEVATVRVSQQAVPIAFEYTGTIISPADAELQARVTGNVIERPFEPGSHVRQGQVLFKIDPRPFQVSLETAQAQQQQAKASLEFAEAEVGRTEKLVEKGYASEQRNQQNVTNRDSAEGKLKETQAAIERQKLNLDYAKVNAPFAGRASLSLVNVGDLVIENQTNLVSIVQVDPIDVQMALSSEDVERVREAMTDGKVEVQLLDEHRDPIRKAVIYKLDNRFDPRTARRLVRAKIQNEDERFLPGQFVRARVQVGEKGRLLVPTVALSAQLDQQIVWTVDENNTVHTTPIETGEVFGDKTAVLKGLKTGAVVVTNHLQSMRENMRVDPGEARSVTAIGDKRAEGGARP